MSQHHQPQFRDSTQISNDLQLAGDPEPQSFTVGPPSTFTRTTGNSQLLTASATPSFPPLVEALKSKQSTSGQPIPFSGVVAHLISTLGHGGFASLYTSVPGATIFGQYVVAAVASGPVPLVGGTATSRIALVSPCNVGPARGMGQWLPDSSSPPQQPSVSTAPPPSLRPFLPRSCGGVHKGSFMHFGPSPRFLRSSGRWPGVVPLLLRRKPSGLVPVSVARFMGYCILAVENAIAMAGWMDQAGGWMSLNDSRPRGPAFSPSSSSENHRRME